MRLGYSCMVYRLSGWISHDADQLGSLIVFSCGFICCLLNSRVLTWTFVSSNFSFLQLSLQLLILEEFITGTSWFLRLTGLSAVCSDSPLASGSGTFLAFCRSVFGHSPCSCAFEPFLYTVRGHRDFRLRFTGSVPSARVSFSDCF